MPTPIGDDAAAHPAKLYISRPLPRAVVERARQTYDVTIGAPSPPRGLDLAEQTRGCSAVLIAGGEKIDAPLLARLDPGIKVIATYSVGYNHIDVAAAQARGLIVTNTPDVLTEATADIAMLLLLGAARRGGEGHEIVRAGRWPLIGGGSTFLLGKNLAGRRLGIVGLGRIGRSVAARARAFGMEIHYHSRKPIDAEQAAGATFHETLESLLGVSDFLSLHCPSSRETRKIINARTLALLPSGAVVVNTARGELVDDEALIAALRTGHVFSAGLDVFAGEPDIHPGYRTLPNVFLLPHVGSATLETRDAMGFRALDNIDAVLQGREPQDRILA